MSEELKKKKILWISVGVIGTTIFLFWAYSFSYNTRSILSNKNNNSVIQVPEIKKGLDDINKEITKIQENIDDTIKEKSPLENNTEIIKKEIEENLKKQLDRPTSTGITN